jgi:hypothetical protein
MRKNAQVEKNPKKRHTPIPTLSPLLMIAQARRFVRAGTNDEICLQMATFAKLNKLYKR